MLRCETNVGDGHRAKLCQRVVAIVGRFIEPLPKVRRSLFSDGLQQSLFIGEVSKRRGRRDTRRASQRSHAQRLDPFGVDEAEGRLQ